MREKIGSAVAAFFFMAIVPGVTFAMIRHIDYGVGVPIIGASVLIGITALAWGFSAHNTQFGRATMGPIIVMGIGGVIYAGGAYWYYRVHAKPAGNNAAEQTIRGPTLEATNNSKIDATGARIPGDLPFQFGKADANSLIDMPGIVVTRKDDGVISVTPAVHTSRAFPPPTGEFSNLSGKELKNTTRTIVAELRHFQEEFDGEFFEPGRKWPEHEKAKAVLNKFSAMYESGLSKTALSLASEILVRIKTIEGSSMSTEAAQGGQVVYHGKLIGPNPASAAAEFLEALSQRLPDN